MDAVAQAYIGGSPALDPDFVRLREQVFDPERAWIRTAGTVLGLGTQKLGPFRARTLSSAFGWEIRPWTQTRFLDEAAVAALAQGVRSLGKWHMGQVNGLSENETALLRAGFSKAGMRVFEFPFPIRIISGVKSYQEYLDRRSKSTIRTQRRYFKNLATLGLEVRYAAAWSDIERVLDSRQAEFDNGADYTRSSKFREFFRNFIEAMRANGRLVCAGIFQGDKMVSYTVGFRSGPVFHCYQTAFDPAFKESRVGSLTLEKSIELALDGGAEVIDFMNGDPYLEFFTKELLPLKRVVFFSNSLKGRFLAMLFRLRSR